MPHWNVGAAAFRVVEGISCARSLLAARLLFGNRLNAVGIVLPVIGRFIFVHAAGGNEQGAFARIIKHGASSCRWRDRQNRNAGQSDARTERVAADRGNLLRDDDGSQAGTF